MSRRSAAAAATTWLLFSLAGCDRGKGAGDTQGPATNTSSSSVGGGGAVPATPSASSVESPPGGEAKPTELQGSYEAKVASVFTAGGAPPFLDVPAGASGPGQLGLELPGVGGAVSGKASGALGAQTFSGWLEEGRLTGTLVPAPEASPRMWGVVDATVEGTGASRKAKGTIRASDENGRVVREASFSLGK